MRNGDLPTVATDDAHMRMRGSQSSSDEHARVDDRLFGSARPCAMLGSHGGERTYYVHR
jgi:hypothetical protein